MKGRNMDTGLSQTDEGQNTERLHMLTSRTATAMFTTILALGGLTACGDSDTLSLDPPMNWVVWRRV